MEISDARLKEVIKMTCVMMFVFMLEKYEDKLLFLKGQPTCDIEDIFKEVKKSLEDKVWKK